MEFLLGLPLLGSQHNPEPRSPSHDRDAAGRHRAPPVPGVWLASKEHLEALRGRA